MKRIWNYIIATLLCAGGCCAYYFNPYRKGSLVVGFILQLFCSILIFANVFENETYTSQQITIQDIDEVAIPYEFIENLNVK